MIQDGAETSKIRDVVETCLRKVQKQDWTHLPQVLLEKGQTRFFILTTNSFLIIDFLDGEEAKRVSELTKKGYFPFPGLIKPATLKMSAAFHFEKTRNALVQGCTVNNMFSFSIGKDTTLIIRDHRQKINTKEFGESSYVIKLAYLISFGDEITNSNLYDELGNLMVESFKQWGISNV